MPRKQAAKARGLDTKLMKQLADASADASVQAVFTLHTPAGKDHNDETATREAVSKIVDEAAAHTNAQPTRMTVFPNVRSFALSGPPALLRKVAQHPDVASAAANATDEDLLIRPPQRPARRRKQP